ncbi:hypothetical protein J3R74_003010 [Puniceicoccus vermicola]
MPRICELEVRGVASFSLPENMEVSLVQICGALNSEKLCSLGYRFKLGRRQLRPWLRYSRRVRMNSRNASYSYHRQPACDSREGAALKRCIERAFDDAWIPFAAGSLAEIPSNRAYEKLGNLCFRS